MSDQKEPWYEREMTKFEIKLMGGIVLAVFVAVFYSMYAMEAKMEATHEQRRQDCKDLNVSYGQSLTAKEGFYKGIEMMAVGAGEETIEVQYMKGFQIDNARFLCADLVVK